MKTTINNEETFLDGINKVILTFHDGEEYVLSHVSEYDLDIDTIEYSAMEFVNMIEPVSLLNRIQRKDKEKAMVRHIHIEYASRKLFNCDETDTLMVDVPCHMYIRSVRLTGEIQGSNGMTVRLEGEID